MCRKGSRLFGVRWTCYVVVGFLMLHRVHSQYSYDERPEILSLHISSDINYRFATTLVVSRVKNPHKVAKEVVFDVTLPNEAFITEFEMEIDGTVYPGEIKEKEQAKTRYDTARIRGESAAHIKERPTGTNIFYVQVNVAAESNVTFNLTYQELLRRKRGLYHHVVYIDPGQPVQDMNVWIHIQESRNISVVRVPPLIGTHKPIPIARPSPNSAFIQFAPTIRQQMDYDQNGISGRFVVEYDIERSRDAGEILVVNGYFVHFFAPTGLKPFPKDVLFIVDVSGSMSGEKIEQVSSAMTTVLFRLNKNDRMDIMTFSDDTHFWKNEMVNCTEENMMEAEMFITSKIPFGGTNINKALVDGIKHLLKLEKSEFRKPMIVFVTDGNATVGETNSEIILENIENENEKGVIPIFTLAFGEESDYDLLKAISTRSNGVARRIYEASDAKLQISGFYDEISAALMTDLVFHYLDGSVDNATVTKSHFFRYLEGSEMIVAGKMSKDEAKTIPLQVIGNRIEGSKDLIINTAILESAEFTNTTTLASIENITEKIWAYLTIKQNAEKLESSTNDSEKESLKASALALSLKYMFVTPLTSMVVTKQDDTKSISSLGTVPSLQSRHWSRTTYRRFQPTHVGKVKSIVPPGIDGVFQSQGQLSTDFRGRFGAGFQPPYPDQFPYRIDGVFQSQGQLSTDFRGRFGAGFQPPYPEQIPYRGRSGAWFQPPYPDQIPYRGRFGAGFKRPYPDQIRFPSPLTTVRTTLRRTSVRNHGPKMYPIRIKFNNTPYANCFSIPDNGSYDTNHPLQLLHSPDGITVHANVGSQAQRDHIRAISIRVNSSRIDINTAAIYIVEVYNIRKYDWGSHNLLLSNVKLYVEPSKVRVEAEGLNILIHKIGNPSKGLGLFMNETTFPIYSSPSGLLPTLAGGRSSPYWITSSGHTADDDFVPYTLTDLSAGDIWHGDSKCYTVQRDYMSHLSP
ncbi:hypothetical protein CHS0354_008950 [Potamilus streckersoni]|uniref:Uncharacterized protein n=1 Tax=Potamilus streckersoni TaxID=2493646 RepID=A0AAE0THJ1_9BIVA|nr:hypothetical protein CHS0354_008950 [Potamilus streckersoni]